MRKAWIFAAAAVTIIAASARPSEARHYERAPEAYPWCAHYIFQPAAECLYVTFEQCMASISGVGGQCQYNPVLSFAGENPRGRRWR